MEIKNLDLALKLKDRLLDLAEFKKRFKKNEELEIGIIINYGHNGMSDTVYGFSKATYIFSMESIRSLVLEEENKILEKIKKLK